jgi:uncharacterized surface protein with fasciclin (FAS1) repeats
MRKMSLRNKSFIFVLTFVFIFTFSVFNTSSAEDMMDIVDTAIQADDFNTLVTAVQEAGLVEALKGEGPFTVFAPTDAAFAALPEGTLDALLANPDKLRDVLLYHVVSGKVMAKDVVGLDGAMVETLLGEDIEITIMDGDVYINNSKVITTDIETSNGVIHVIDAVLVPSEEMMDIVDTAVKADDFNTLVTAVQQAGLVEALKGEGPFTVFAPTDAAFAALPEGTLVNLLANPDLLSDVLLYHVISGKVMADDVFEMGSGTVNSLKGDPIDIKLVNSRVFINEAEVIITDIETTNGVIHAIDTVLIPYDDLFDIVDTAARTKNLETLVTAVTEAGLVDVLKGPGPYTVFAPINSAFADLPDIFLEHLLKNKSVLRSYLLYHVIEGKVMAEDVLGLDGASVNTLLGKDVKVSIMDGKVYIDDAQVIVTDIETKNGVIHFIDKVLVP